MSRQPTLAVLARGKRRLRERSEYALRLAAMKDIARRYPGQVARSALPPEGPFWRYLFVPLYRRVPWNTRRRAMRALKMTAQGWPEHDRRFRQPWRPPAAERRAGHDGERQQEAQAAGP